LAISEISDRTELQIDLERIEIAWLNRVSFDHLLIKDFEGDTLLYVKKLGIKYRLRSLLNKDFLKIQEIALTESVFKMKKTTDSAQYNLTNVVNLLKSDPSASKERNSKPIAIEEIKVLDLNGILDGGTADSLKEGLDFKQMNWSFEEIDLHDFNVKKDTISGHLTRFTGNETGSGFQINDLSTRFRLTNQSLSIDNLNFFTPTSHITDSLEFFYNGFDDFGTFIDSVSFVLYFDETLVSPHDLELLLGKEVLKTTLTIEGIIQVGKPKSTNSSSEEGSIPNAYS
jgi:hypothetical protein